MHRGRYGRRLIADGRCNGPLSSHTGLIGHLGQGSAEQRQAAARIHSRSAQEIQPGAFCWPGSGLRTPGEVHHKQTARSSPSRDPVLGGAEHLFSMPGIHRGQQVGASGRLRVFSLPMAGTFAMDLRGRLSHVPLAPYRALLPVFEAIAKSGRHSRASTCAELRSTAPDCPNPLARVVSVHPRLAVSPCSQPFAAALAPAR